MDGKSRKKILILLPEGKIHKISVGPFQKSFREAPLTATALSALVPKELDYDVTICDESIQPVPFDKTFDLVAISIITGMAYRAYEIAAAFKKKEAIIVLGGVHVTLLPDEAAKYADAIVVGFAEKTWPQLLHDFEKGNLKPVYKDLQQHFENIPDPCRELQKKNGYMVPNVVSATRGCKNTCDFCAVPAAGFGWQTRPIGEVIDEISRIPSRKIVFNDVSMGEDMDYFKELLRAMIPLKKTWGGLVSTKVFNDPETIGLLKKSGCAYLLIGFESLNDFSLQRINKGFNRFDEYKSIINQLRSIDVILMACFIFGFEEDDNGIFRKTVDFVNEYRVNIPRYAIYTPYPGTESFKRLKAEGRLLHENWAHYDTQHVVFLPKLMSPEELDAGLKWAYKNTFTISSSFKRTITSGKNFLLTFGGNLAYRIYLKRLFSEKERILYPLK